MANTRAPIVTILGHVDHGKTTLLDYIRKTNVAAREIGGITQRIAAFSVTTRDGPITFIDTPGHQTFWAMRSRGAAVADIAILVVAANEGVKPQTRESLEQIKKSQIPFLVAATKTDLPSADPGQVRSQLEKEGVSFEGQGGDVPLVEVSAKTGQGIDHLLELVILLAQVHEVSGNPGGPLEAIVIESRQDQRRGPSASVIIRSGTLKVGDVVAAERVGGKVRALIDTTGRQRGEIGPGQAAEVLGFETLPPVGAAIVHGAAAPAAKSSVQPTQEGALQLVIRADTQGGLEALIGSLPPAVSVLAQGMGEATANDVLMASSFKTPVLVFGSKVPPDVANLAGEEGVVIGQFHLIYEALAWIEDLLLGRQKPEPAKEVLGRAEIVVEFPFGSGGKIAGVRVTDGRIAKGDILRVIRGRQTLDQTRIASLKQQSKSIDKVEKGQECGIVFAQQVDFKAGDMLESIRS